MSTEQNINDLKILTEAAIELRELRNKVREMKTQETILADTILKVFKELNSDGDIIEKDDKKYSVTRVVAIKFKTTIEEARAYGATFKEEKVDTKILRKLYDVGEEIPNAEEQVSVRVAELKEEEK